MKVAKPRLERMRSEHHCIKKEGKYKQHLSVQVHSENVSADPQHYKLSRRFGEENGGSGDPHICCKLWGLRCLNGLCIVSCGLGEIAALLP